MPFGTARTNTLVVAAALALAVTSGGSLGWLAILLAAGFAIKVVAGSAYSPMCLLASGVNRLVGVRSRPGDWALKRFAAGLRLAFSLAASTGWLLGLNAVFYGASVALAACASLEGALGFCLGCWMYGLIPRRKA